MWRKGNTLALLVGIGGNGKLIQPLWKMVWKFLKKPGIKLPRDPGF